MLVDSSGASRRAWSFRFPGGTVQIPSSIDVKIRSQVATGQYENAECELIEAFLPRDQPVVELGGCLGIVSSVIARHLEPGVTFSVTEANPHLIDICSQNATLNGTRRNVRLNCAAICYKNDNVDFSVSKNVHVSQLGDAGRKRNMRRIKVPAMKLSDVIEQAGIDGNYSLICDIEGAETEIFEKDAAALARCDLVIVELHPRQYIQSGRSLDEVVGLIIQHGFTERRRVGDVFAFDRESPSK